VLADVYDTRAGPHQPEQEVEAWGITMIELKPPTG
jgi:hypothetical protein